MGKHRADVADNDAVPLPVLAAPSPQSSQSGSSYAGKRRAAILGSGQPSPVGYVGKRRAVPTGATGDSGTGPLTVPAPRTAASGAPSSRDSQLPGDETLEHMLGLQFEDTAPHPRVRADLFEMPRPRAQTDQVPEAPASAAPVPPAALVAPEPATVQEPTQAATVKAPAAHRAAPAATPQAKPGRRKAERARRRKMPLVAGTTAAVVTAGGIAAAVVLAHGSATDPVPAQPTPDSSKQHTSDRSQETSRGASRAKLEAQAKKHAEERAEAKKKAAITPANNPNHAELPIPFGVYHLTGRFGETGSLWSSHDGLDFAAPYGTPIHAVMPGVIVEAQYSGDCGYETKEELADGTDLIYCHQSEYAVSVGDKVKVGEVIGYVGSTGHSTGPHVHLGVRPDGVTAVDPEAWLKEHGVDPDTGKLS